MRIVLIPSLNIVERRIEPYVPYGLLSLQAAARAQGCSLDILELPDSVLDETFSSSTEIVERILGLIPQVNIDIYGLSVVCNTAHISLDLASRLKSISSRSKIVIGGPYGTKIAPALLRAFSFLDAVAIGEGEKTIGAMVLAKTAAQALRAPGLFNRNGLYTPEVAIENLDNLPFVGTDTYFRWLDAVRRLVPEGAATPLEATRGCPLKCSFCSTKQVWGAKVRRKTAEHLTDEMRRISLKTGQTFFHS